MPAYAVFHVAGWVLLVLAVLMLPPAAVAVALDPVPVVQAFVFPAVSVAFLGGAMVLAFRERGTTFGRWQSLLLLGFVWTVVPVAGALPFYAAGIPKTAVAAFFEAMSGFTTTGATAIVDLSQAPTAIILWRALLQWAGGLATLVALVTILSPLIGSELLDRQLRMLGRRSHRSARQVFDALQTIAPIYALLTAACFIGLLLSGIPAFDALCLSLSTVSTGGFMPRNGTIALYGSPAAELCLTVFMVASAVSVVWLRALLQMRWRFVRQTREPYWIFALVTGLGVILCVLLTLDGAQTGWAAAFHALTLGLATAASIVSTTGFAISDSMHQFVPYMVLLGLCIMGGGRLSTAGGLKVYRIVAMLRQMDRELRLLVYPHGVRSSWFGRETADTAVIQAIWIMFAAYVVVHGTLAIVLASTGIRLAPALLAAAGAISNIGPAYDMARLGSFPEAPLYAAMSPLAQIALSLGMVLGRVEILALLTLLNFANWRE